MKKWQTFEDRIRGIATLIHGRTCAPEQVAGVDVDGVIEVNPGHFILFEITVRSDLQKVRDDIIKLRTARSGLLAQDIYTDCYCVIDGKVTTAMDDAGKPHRIRVFDGESFSRISLILRPINLRDDGHGLEAR